MPVFSSSGGSRGGRGRGGFSASSAPGASFGGGGRDSSGGGSRGFSGSTSKGGGNKADTLKKKKPLPPPLPKPKAKAKPKKTVQQIRKKEASARGRPSRSARIIASPQKNQPRAKAGSMLGA